MIIQKFQNHFFNYLKALKNVQNYLNNSYDRPEVSKLFFNNFNSSKMIQKCLTNYFDHQKASKYI